MMAAASALAMVSMTPAATAATEHIAAPSASENYAVNNYGDAPSTGADNMLLTTRAGLGDRGAGGSIDNANYSMSVDTTIGGALTST